MQVYRGLDIGTAKPDLAARQAVPHHLIDVADPNEEWSVARTQTRGRAAVRDIETRGHRALLVGGTGLYVQAVIDDLRLPGEDLARRADLEARTAEPGGVARAYEELRARDPAAAARIDPHNARRLVRALEVIATTGQLFSSFGPGVSSFGTPAFPTRMAGVWLPRDRLAERIARRVDDMRRAGLVDEVRATVAGTGLGRTACQAIGYRELADALDAGHEPDPTLFDAIARRTRSFARRQRMWFRRDPRHHLVRERRQSVPGAPRPPGSLEAVTMRLAKLHATGNDFLVADAPGPDPTSVPWLCDRRRGIGADGLLVLGPGADGADCTMTLFNADGGQAEMSGNGIRCLAWVAVERGIATGQVLTVDTAAGRRRVDLGTTRPPGGCAARPSTWAR